MLNFMKLKKDLIRELKDNKISFSVYVVLRILVIITLFSQLFNGNYENVFLCLLTLLLLILPTLFIP